MTLPPGNSDFGSPSSEEPLFGEPTTTSDVYATPAYGSSTTPTGSPGDDASAKQKAADAAAGAKDKAADVKDNAVGKAADVKDNAVGKAADVKDSAVDAGTHVASVAKEQAGSVVAEAGQHAKSLVAQTRTELGTQVASQQQRLATGIRTLADDLESMAGSGKSGMAADLARQASQRTKSVASLVENREPAALVGDLSAFARRRPGVFIALAALSGLLAGRLARGVRDEATADPVAPSYAATGVDTGYSTDTHLGSVGAGSVGSVGSVDAGLESGSYATGSYATSADPLAFEDGGTR